jgi:hypothetical protein
MNFRLGFACGAALCLLPVAGAVVAPSEVAVGTYSAVVKVFQKGHRKAKTTGSLIYSVSDTADIRIDLDDRYSKISAILFADGRYRVRILNKHRKERVRRAGTWAYMNPTTVRAISRESGSTLGFQDIFLIPEKDPDESTANEHRVALTITLKRGTHEKVFGRG